MDAFFVGVIAAFFQLALIFLWVILEGLMPSWADARGWPYDLRRRRIRKMRWTLAITTLIVIAIPVTMGSWGSDLRPASGRHQADLPR